MMMDYHHRIKFEIADYDIFYDELKIIPNFKKVFVNKIHEWIYCHTS